MDVEQVLRTRDHVVVALDGPIADMPSMAPQIERLRVMVAGARLPRRAARTEDPFVLLAHAATIGPATAAAVNQQLARIESEVLLSALVTPGVHEAFAMMASAGTTITVVSSLHITAVRSFLVLHGLLEYVRQHVARVTPDVKVLPPNPEFVTKAVHHRAVPASSCLFVGRKSADLRAARAAGVETLRYRRPTTTDAESSWLAGKIGQKPPSGSACVL